MAAPGIVGLLMLAVIGGCGAPAAGPQSGANRPAVRPVPHERSDYLVGEADSFAAQDAQATRAEKPKADRSGQRPAPAPPARRPVDQPRLR